jgi:hypothetical protein
MGWMLLHCDYYPRQTPKVFLALRSTDMFTTHIIWLHIYEQTGNCVAITLIRWEQVILRESCFHTKQSMTSLPHGVLPHGLSGLLWFVLGEKLSSKLAFFGFSSAFGELSGRYCRVAFLPFTITTPFDRKPRSASKVDMKEWREAVNLLIWPCAYRDCECETVLWDVRWTYLQ